jgi:3'(2'), 5'-bisphosphate nucleotidase
MPIRNTTQAAASDADIARIFENLALEAGKLIMDVFASEFEVDSKADLSPVTAADRNSERLILEGLRREFPDIPCVAEEESAAGAVPGDLGSVFMLVDPLDGTREFCHHRPDFTVNIAMIRDGAPAIGVVYAPARGELYSGIPGRAELIQIGDGYVETGRHPISVRGGFPPLTIVASRSHRTDDTDLYIRKFAAAEIVSVGSSLKFCLIAAGQADLYPRFGSIMEWDTAAGDAVLRAAGGVTLTLDGAALTYGKRGRPGIEDFVNPSFIAKGRIEEL